MRIFPLLFKPGPQLTFEAPTLGRSFRYAFLLGLLLVLAAFSARPARAQNRSEAGFFSNYIVLSTNTGAQMPADRFYRTNQNPNTSDQNNPLLQGANLGTFDRTQGPVSLRLGAELNTYQNSGADYNNQPVRVFYRVYPQGANPTATGINFTAISVPRTGQSPTSNPSDSRYTATSQLNPNNRSDDLIAPTSASLPDLGPGTYTLEIYIQATYTFNGQTLSTFDSDNGANYRVTFTVVTPTNTPDGQTTQWISNRNPDGSQATPGSSLGANSDWLDPRNWSNGVPTRNSDALIPDHATTTIPTVAPNLYDPNATYEVRNLNMPNANFTDRSLLRLGRSTTISGNTTNAGAQLFIYGNLNVPGAGLLSAVSGTNGVANPQTNSTIVFAGNTTQSIRGTLNTADIVVQGTGDKNLFGTINVQNTFTFANGTTARLVTVDSDGNFVAAQNISQVNLDVSGTLFGETNLAYVLGTLISSRTLTAGVNQTFGNVGLEINSSQTVTQTPVIITRSTGVFFQPVGSNRVSIKRIFGVSGDVNTNGSTNIITFRYLDSDGTDATHNPPDNELNGVAEPNLRLFRTANGNSGPFIPLPSTVNPAANTLTATVNNINTISAGDRTAPLPVVLTGFLATRVGDDVRLSWTTASETNNRGFAVQVSTDGATFRTLGFVGSLNANSAAPQAYSFLDREPGKAGTRYYRLQQQDLDGRSVFSPVRTVSFGGNEVAPATVALYPNPFQTGEAVTLLLGGQPEGSARVLVADVAGRTVSQQTQALSNGSLSLTGLDALPTGLYLVRVTLANGATQTLRLQKK